MAQDVRTNLQVAWDNVAAAYEHWYDQFERDAQPINDWICRSVKLTPGMHVLDLGSGSGQPAFTAAQFVSPKGSVIATYRLRWSTPYCDVRRAPALRIYGRK